VFDAVTVEGIRRQVKKEILPNYAVLKCHNCVTELHEQLIGFPQNGLFHGRRVCLSSFWIVNDKFMAKLFHQRLLMLGDYRC